MIETAGLNLLFRDTFTDTNAVALDDHVPDYGPPWVKLNYKTNTISGEIQSNALIPSSAALIAYAVNLPAPAREIRLLTTSPGATSLIYTALITRLSYKKTGDRFDVGAPTILLRSDASNEDIYVAKISSTETPAQVVNDPNPTPTVDLKTDDVTFVFQDHSRFIRGWYQTDVAASYFNYDTNLDSDILPFGGNTIGLLTSSGLSAKMRGIEVYG